MVVVVTKSDPPEEVVEVCEVVEERVDELDEEADVGDAVAVDVELVIVTVTVTNLLVEVCDGSGDGLEEFVALLPELVTIVFAGGSKTWAPGGTCEEPCPPSAPVATTSEPAAPRTTRIKMESTDSFWIIGSMSPCDLLT